MASTMKKMSASVHVQPVPSFTSRVSVHVHSVMYQQQQTITSVSHLPRLFTVIKLRVIKRNLYPGRSGTTSAQSILHHQYLTKVILNQDPHHVNYTLLIFSNRLDPNFKPRVDRGFGPSHRK